MADVSAPHDGDLLDTRRAITRAAKAMAASGLVTGSSGNVSLRFAERFLITPSGIAYDRLELDQIVEIDAEGTSLSGRGEPSSEWRMHIAIYRERPDVTAIVHTHSVHATAASLSLTQLPVLHDEGLVLFGDSIPISRPEAPGTWELAEAVVAALADARGTLIAKHGVVSIGQTLDEALGVAVKIEEAAHVYVHTRQLGLSA